jgi:1-acyl-sn-glycerol-3-phosphate acyltransferase
MLISPAEGITYKEGVYKTACRQILLPARLLPSFVFYRLLLGIVLRSSASAKRSRYGTREWILSSLEVMRALEYVGVTIEITGIDHVRTLQGPCIFASNHMSTLETFLLPGMVGPYRELTFVVKQSLVDVPVIRHVMRSRDPITVGRANPRDDLRAVLEGGRAKLKAGVSIILFPEAYRSPIFDPKRFNSSAVKLARDAQVPVIPIALKTDAWGTGRMVKDFGKIDPSKPVHFAFGSPLWVKDRGTDAHQEVLAFIAAKLTEWSHPIV